MRSSALYFPTIAFQSQPWLTSSLLVWDHVYRIIPEQYHPQDTDDIRLAEDEGLVRSVAPEAEDRAAAAEHFEEFWEKVGDEPAGFVESDPPDTVHLDKIDSRLYPLLESAAATISGNSVEMPRGMARAYMLILAQEMGRRRALILATDNPDAWVLDAYIREEGDFSHFIYDDDAPYQYCHFGFPSLLPVDIADLSMKELVKLAHSSGTARKEFREMAGDLLKELSRCESAAHASQIADDFRDGITSAVDSLRSHFAPFNRSGVFALLSVGVPVMASALPALLPKEAVFPTSIVIGVVAALSQYYMPRPHQDPIGSYFLQVDRSLRKRSLIPNFAASMEEFIND